MYARILTTPIEIGQSFFLFGPRGTGKTTWLHTRFPDSIYLDLLKSSTYTDLLARPDRLEEMITPPYDRWIVIDEVQRVPAVLNEVHRLIENRGYKFILTGSSARTLRRGGTNLLAGRALTFHMYPFTAEELGDDFQIDYSLDFGHLPSLYDGAQPTEYLASYVSTYLREEVLQEGLTRSIEAFSRFIETASFSQAAPINYSEIAREAAINRKTIESYFSILADLLLSFSLPVFTKRAKRRLMSHNKFYYFDAGVYRTIRQAGPLDSPQEIGGVALETLCLQEIRAINEYYRFGYSVYYWRTSTGLEVDFILYGQLGLIAIEVKHARGVSTSALSGLKAFGRDYPEARRYLFYMGDHEEVREGIHVIPAAQAIRSLRKILAGSDGH